MELTKERKDYIDNLSYRQLLEKWRNAPTGDKWFQGETGKYWGQRMEEVRNRPETDHVAASKSIGWDRL